MRVEFPGEGSLVPPAGLERLHPRGALAAADNDPVVTVGRDPATGDYWFSYTDGCRFRIASGGGSVVAGGPPEMTREDLEVYLGGPILGFALRLQGVVSLHASAVLLGGRVAAFAGGAGAGKSTLAARLALGGAAVVTDDILALEETAGGFRARPVATPLKLWPDSVAQLCGRADALPRLVPASADWDKCRLDEGHPGVRFAATSEPLGVIHLLAPRAAGGGAPRVETVPPAQALMELTAHSYVTYALTRAMRAREFALLGRLVQVVPVRRLTLPERTTGADLLTEFLQHDLSTGGA